MISKQIILEYEQEEGNNESKTYIVYYFQKTSFHIFPRATLMKVIANTDMTTHMPKIVLFLNEPNGPPVPLL